MKNFVIIMTVLFLYGCSPQAKLDLKSEKAALMSAAIAYQEAGTAIDVDKMVAFYTIDAKLIPPGGAVSTGTSEIIKFMEEITKLKNFKAKFGTPEVEISIGGDMGYSLATAILSYEDSEGKVIIEHDRDFHVWKKVDGVWKLAIDIWNSAPANN